MQSGKVAKSEAKGKGKGKKSGKKGKASRKSDGGSGGMTAAARGGAGAGPKPIVDYKATPLEKRKKWAFEMASKVPTPTAHQVVSWTADQVGQFIAQIPIFGLNEWYGAKFVESQVTGKMFLKCNEADLVNWGVDRKCHRARFR